MNFEEFKATMELMLQQKMESPIKVKKFQEDYKALLEKTSETFLIESLELNENESVDELSKKVSLQQLAQPNDANREDMRPEDKDMRRDAPMEQYANQSSLKFVQKFCEYKEKENLNPFIKTSNSYSLLPLPTVEDEQKTRVTVFEDVVVTIRFYHHPIVAQTGKKLGSLKFAEEFECLGSNFLTQLRDKISCDYNKFNFFDISENPGADLPEKKTDPGFFFIHDTFYNDKRNPSNPDYSKTVINWAKKAPGLKDLVLYSKKMEETTFMDLQLSLGFPYLYLHHGNCEHIFTFSQIELLTPSTTCLYKEQYPRLRSHNMKRTRYCCLCGLRRYSYVVQDSKRQIMNPSFVCSPCFYRYYYVDGKKIDDFKAYRICETMPTFDDSDEDESSLHVSPTKDK